VHPIWSCSPWRGSVRRQGSSASGRLRHFLLTWLKTQGIDDALIQPYSGHAHRASLEIYSHLALADAQQRYDEVIDRFPV
jgi:integrase/recombinase XerD